MKYIITLMLLLSSLAFAEDTRQDEPLFMAVKVKAGVLILGDEQRWCDNKKLAALLFDHTGQTVLAKGCWFIAKHNQVNLYMGNQVTKYPTDVFVPIVPNTKKETS